MLLGRFWPPSEECSGSQDLYSWDELLYRMHCIAPSFDPRMTAMELMTFAVNPRFPFQQFLLTNSAV